MGLETSLDSTEKIVPHWDTISGPSGLYKSLSRLCYPSRHIQGVPGGMKKFRESVPYVKIYRYNPKHLYPKLNGYGDNGQRSLKL
jgi:hypothetical protein